MIYAGFWRRLAAFIIDALIVSIPVTLIFGPMVAVETVSLGITDPTKFSPMQAGLLGATVFSWQVVLLVVMWLYFAFLESGKKEGLTSTTKTF